jgi:hypothetical protein
MPSRQETLEAYVGAWNTTDEAECRRLLERSWAETATYTDPSIHLQGRDALVAYCLELTKHRKGAKVIITSDVDGHHHVARFSWAVVGEDGSRLRAGIDFAEFGPEGDLTRIVGFFDA